MRRSAVAACVVLSALGTAARDPAACQRELEDALAEPNIAAAQRSLGPYLAEVKALDAKNTGHTIEGSSTARGREMAVYKILAEHSCVDTICEIGFNRGHSALNWLLHSRESVTVHEFDLGEWSSARAGAALLAEKYGNRLRMHWGSSIETVPAATAEGLTCDVIVVDGGHSWQLADADMANMRRAADPARWHVVAIDDTRCLKRYCEGPVLAVAAWKQRNLFAEFRPGFSKDLFLLGTYTQLGGPVVKPGDVPCPRIPAMVFQHHIKGLWKGGLTNDLKRLCQPGDKYRDACNDDSVNREPESNAPDYRGLC